MKIKVQTIIIKNHQDLGKKYSLVPCLIITELWDRWNDSPVTAYCSLITPHSAFTSGVKLSLRGLLTEHIGLASWRRAFSEWSTWQLRHVSNSPVRNWIRYCIHCRVLLRILSTKSHRVSLMKTKKRDFCQVSVPGKAEFLLGNWCVLNYGSCILYFHHIFFFALVAVKFRIQFVIGFISCTVSLMYISLCCL